MRQLLMLLFAGVHYMSFGQDTLKQLDLNSFLQQIKENHPVALVAANNVEASNQLVRMSKGAFDPVLLGGVDQKYFDGKTYYSTISTGVKIPTRLGIDLKLMGDWNRGVYLNNQNIVPDQGLTTIGIDVPIGRGMFTDERRTQLKRATVAMQQSVLEQQLTLNDLLYEAGQTYIYWQEQEAQLVLALEGLRFAELRYQQLVINTDIGERAAIDTVEASAQLFLRQLDVQQRQLNAQNARLAVENYLWDKGTLPLVLETFIQPKAIELTVPKSLLPDSINHPVLSWYDLKRKDLQLERKLKIEQLKPQLNVNYNLLQTPQNLAAFNYSITNYKWGASLYMPILLRKERSSLQMTNLKLENVTFEQDQKQRDLRTKQVQIRNEWNTLSTQAQTAQTIADRYRQLALAERLLFEGGESSLFLINAREISYLSAQSKYIEFLAKTQKAALSEKYVIGALGL
ncbi:MAG: TolC family protein [Fluviicola sp.]|nr:TolC family protein [Fluviicola sp.]